MTNKNLKSKFVQKFKLFRIINNTKLINFWTELESNGASVKKKSLTRQCIEFMNNYMSEYYVNILIY